MAELTNTFGEGREEGSSKAVAQARAARGDWPVRDAIFFWFVVSGAMWTALAATAVWIY